MAGCDDKVLRMVMEAEVRNFFWDDDCDDGDGDGEATSGTAGIVVPSGYHYVPELGAAIPDGYVYDAGTGMVRAPGAQTMVVERSSGGGSTRTPGTGGFGTITQTPAVTRSTEAAGTSSPEWPEPPYHPPAGSIWEHVSPPTTGWLRLGMTKLIHPANTGNVALILVQFRADGHEMKHVILQPGDRIDWYVADGAVDIGVSSIYPKGAAPTPDEVRELTYMVPVNPPI